MAQFSNVPQRSLDWYRDRLGKITGSSVGDLMGKGKGAEFSKTGLSYLNSVAAERMLPDVIVSDDDLFSQYVDEVDISNKAMRIGSEREAEARDLYVEVTKTPVMESGSIPSSSLEGFASSPDGLVVAEETGEIEGTIEIKCPKPSTYFEYKTSVKDATSLLKTNPDYYWQCISHMEVTGAKWCDFIVFCPYNRLPLHIVRINRDEEAITKLKERVATANKYLNDLLTAA